MPSLCCGGDPEDGKADDAEHLLDTLLLEAAGDERPAADLGDPPRPNRGWASGCRHRDRLGPGRGGGAGEAGSGFGASAARFDRTFASFRHEKSPVTARPTAAADVSAERSLRRGHGLARLRAICFMTRYKPPWFAAGPFADFGAVQARQAPLGRAVPASFDGTSRRFSLLRYQRTSVPDGKSATRPTSS